MSEVKTLHFEGTLRLSYNPEVPYVGERSNIWENADVLHELREITGYGDNQQCAVQVTLLRAALSAQGILDFTQGSTEYGTYTPGSPSKFCVGETDFLDFLERYDGQHVVIDIAVPPAVKS